MAYEFDEYTADIYAGKCRRDGPPQEGYYRIKIPRRQRRGAGKEYLPAWIFKGVPLDPVTGEIMDRSAPVYAEIDGFDVDYRLVWATGEPTTKENYEWLKAIRAIRTIT